MPTSDNGVESHVSAAFNRENVAFHGNEDEVLAIAAEGPARRRPGRRTSVARTARYLARFLLLHFSAARHCWLSELSPNVVEQSERRWAYVVAGVIGLRVRRDHLQQRALGSPAAVERGNNRRQPPASCRRVRGGQSRHGGSAGWLGDRTRHRAAIFLRAVLHRGSRQDAGRFPRDQPRRRARISHHRHQREQHGGAGIHRRSANAVRQAAAII